MTTAPDWPTCTHPDGCIGVMVPPHLFCLAHLDGDQYGQYIETLGPTAEIDLRGVAISSALWSDISTRLTPEQPYEVRLGRARFDQAKFTDPIEFQQTRFLKDATFDGAHFEATSGFYKAEFHGSASFKGAIFADHSSFIGSKFEWRVSFNQTHFRNGISFSDVVSKNPVWFDGAEFTGRAAFTNVTFGVLAEPDVTGPQLQRTMIYASFKDSTWNGRAFFNRSTVLGEAHFQNARFTQEVWFNDINITGKADFTSATFERVFLERAHFDDSVTFSPVGDAYEFDCTFANFGGAVDFQELSVKHAISFVNTAFKDSVTGQLLCNGDVNFSRCRMTRHAQLYIEAKSLILQYATLTSGARFTLNATAIDFRNAAFAKPVSVTSAKIPFRGRFSTFTPKPPLQSVVRGLDGVDASNLVLSDMDLTFCAFSGGYNIDQIKIDGPCSFDTPPVRKRFRFGWTSRKVIFEEVVWRASRNQWPATPMTMNTVEPHASEIAAIYRELRKASEDDKNEPGAADFYYGEMEARRHNPQTPRGERFLLHTYWLLSGYALRATRALGFLLVAMLVTLFLTMMWGLPNQSPKQQVTGIVPTTPGAPITLTASTPDPTLTLPYKKRVAEDRAEKASEVVVNSVVFRSSGQNLTTPGTWIEMASRITEPVLIGFAAVAARGRVKR